MGVLAFLLKRPVRWILVALAVPVTVWLADAAADRIERGRGETILTRWLRLPGRIRSGELLFSD